MSNYELKKCLRFATHVADWCFKMLIHRADEYHCCTSELVVHVAGDKEDRKKKVMRPYAAKSADGLTKIFNGTYRQ